MSQSALQKNQENKRNKAPDNTSKQAAKTWDKRKIKQKQVRTNGFLAASWRCRRCPQSLSQVGESSEVFMHYGSSGSSTTLQINW